MPAMAGGSDSERNDAVRRRVAEAAKRALSEAAERRRTKGVAPDPPAEIGGRDAPDPVRYGDWESKGRASDF
jgi:hypothetical protein